MRDHGVPPARSGTAPSPRFRSSVPPRGTRDWTRVESSIVTGTPAGGPHQWPITFRDRSHAGRELATRLERLREEHPVVLGLPRGGVPVAAAVAESLGAPLDVVLVRKLGVPYQPELAVGAIGECGVRVVNEEILRAARVSDAQLSSVEARERLELERRAAAYRSARARVPLGGRTVVIVDDGIATGSTARAACQVARALGAAKVVVASPVAPPSTVAQLSTVADEVVCVETPEPFYAIGEWYRDFSQTTDDEVVALLRESGDDRSAGDERATGRGFRPYGPAAAGSNISSQGTSSIGARRWPGDTPLKGANMQASVGDRIIVRGHHMGEPDRVCEVLEVHGQEGGPPYVVRWSDSGQEGLFFPGPDASVSGHGSAI